jgi:Ser/Thr protein kinase RdoA (MazF antagonist)
MRAQFLDQLDRDRVPGEAVARWGLGCPVQHVQDSESFVYRVEVGGQTAFLRLTHAGHRSRELIEAELAFVEYLANAGVAVARPMPSAAGSLIESLGRDPNTFHASVFQAAPGNQFSLQSVDDDAGTIRRWGQLMGMIHSKSANYRPSDTQRFRWDEDDVWSNAGIYIPHSESSALRELQEVGAWMTDQQTNRSVFGLIHGDLCAANFRVCRDSVTAFDFDDCCNHWFVYDIVCALAPYIGRRPEQRKAIRDLFVEGYEVEHSLDDEWEMAFDQLLRARGLYLFILNHRNWVGKMVDHPKRRFLDLLRKSFVNPIRW